MLVVVCQCHSVLQAWTIISHVQLQFYSREAFQHYNMLNGFFFEDEGQTSLCSFVSKDLEKTVLVVDPPFGALAGLIARHLKGMWTMLGHGMCPWCWW